MFIIDTALLFRRTEVLQTKAVHQGLTIARATAIIVNAIVGAFVIPESMRSVGKAYDMSRCVSRLIFSVARRLFEE